MLFFVFVFFLIKNSRDLNTEVTAGSCSSISVTMRPMDLDAALKVKAKPSLLHSWEQPDAWEQLLEMLLRTRTAPPAPARPGLGSEPLIPAVRSGTLHTRCSNKIDLVQG